MPHRQYSRDASWSVRIQCVNSAPRATSAAYIARVPALRPDVHVELAANVHVAMRGPPPDADAAANASHSAGDIGWSYV